MGTTRFLPPTRLLERPGGCVLYHSGETDVCSPFFLSDVDSSSSTFVGSFTNAIIILK